MPQRANANLVIPAPRTGRTWLALASTIGALGMGAGAIFTAFPDWARTGGVFIAGAALVLAGWWLLPAGRLEFDLGRGLLLRDGHRLARLADIECVRITEPGIADENAPYLVELCRDGEPLVLVGHTRDEVEASSLAARIAGALGRPVTVA
jgi:hypothetical protein